MRILIVGGVAGGASAATRARRLSEEAEIVIFERGEHISFANCGLPYHIGGTIPDRDRLIIQTPEAIRKTYRIDVRTRTEVLRIDPPKKQVITKDLATGTERNEPYDFLILSPGAEPVRPPLSGIDSKQIRSELADMDAIKKRRQTKERALVIEAATSDLKWRKRYAGDKSRHARGDGLAGHGPRIRKWRHPCIRSLLTASIFASGLRLSFRDETFLRRPQHWRIPALRPCCPRRGQARTRLPKTPASNPDPRRISSTPGCERRSSTSPSATRSNQDFITDEPSLIPAGFKPPGGSLRIIFSANQFTNTGHRDSKSSASRRYDGCE